MTPSIESLTPFFEDCCWMFVLLARQASVGVILRRGPTEWWRVTLWDTRRDRFEGGQWFRGRIYPEKCDVSPDGKLFVYFAGKWRARSIDLGYSDTWTAVSRPPYLTALALWPIGGTYGGQGIFLDDRTLRGSPSLEHHPDHPPGPLRMGEYASLKKGDPRRKIGPSWENGWHGVLGPRATTRYSEMRKTSGSLILGRKVEMGDAYPSRRRSLYTLYRSHDEPVALFEAHWADWDQGGRLVATAGGRVLAGKLTAKNKLVWRRIASMEEEKPTRIEAPSWAQRW
jgi:hypothetical protein